MASNRPFKATPVEEVASIAKLTRVAFNTQKTKPLEWRKVQLRKLYWSLTDHKDALVHACKVDLGKSEYETYLTEIDWCRNDIIFVLSKLDKWAADESPPDIPFIMKFVSPHIRKDPMGAVLVIGAFNYPVQLSLGPFIGAIAAGCTGVLKPSEQVPNVAMVLQSIVHSVMDNQAFRVVQGGVPETTELLNQKWDKIFYTGSGNVGTIIAKKAAETLTPVALELGGRNPAIITRRADIRLAARRLLWGKFHNAGQVCVSQNYVLIDRDVLATFIGEIKKAAEEFYPKGAKASPDYGRMPNERSFNRIKKMLDSTNGQIIMGGTMDASDRFIEPTVVQVNDVNDSLIKDESFGPLIPILPVDNLDQAIRIANEVDATPLALYPFGSKTETAQVLNRIRSGGATVNDSFFHASIPTLSFGGVGESGTGAYRGRASFDCFTHRRSVATTPAWLEPFLSVRYPPYLGKLKQAQAMNGKPNFDRNGKLKAGLIYSLLTLGAGTAKGGAARYGLLLLLLGILSKYNEFRAKL